jgi:hypothetical protein
VASDLRRGDDTREREEQDLVTQEFPLSDVERMIREAEIKDAATIAALGLLRMKRLALEPPCRSPVAARAVKSGCGAELAAERFEASSPLNESGRSCAPAPTGRLAPLAR